MLAAIIGLALIVLGYATPYLSLLASRVIEENSAAGERIKADRVGAWIMVGGFFVLVLGLVNLMKILPK